MTGICFDWLGQNCVRGWDGTILCFLGQIHKHSSSFSVTLSFWFGPFWGVQMCLWLYLSQIFRLTNQTYHTTRQTQFRPNQSKPKAAVHRSENKQSIFSAMPRFGQKWRHVLFYGNIVQWFLPALLIRNFALGGRKMSQLFGETPAKLFDSWLGQTNKPHVIIAIILMFLLPPNLLILPTFWRTSCHATELAYELLKEIQSFFFGLEFLLLLKKGRMN